MPSKKDKCFICKKPHNADFMLIIKDETAKDGLADAEIVCKKCLRLRRKIMDNGDVVIYQIIKQ